MTTTRLNFRSPRGRAGPPAVAIVGAGVAGLACAKTLAIAGLPVALFDKGRRPGGRVATRRVDGFAFDHGAQYFTAESDALRRLVAAGQQGGTVAGWDGRIVTLPDTNPETCNGDRRRWVGVPGMSALASQMSVGLDIRCGRRVVALGRAGGGWRLIAEDGSTLVLADLVVVAVPAPQAVPLLASSAALANRAGSAVLAPCWAAMIGFDEPPAAPFDAAFVEAGPLSWIARDRSKPGRGGGEAWVLHASPSWSRDHLEADGRGVAEALERAFRTTVGETVPKSAFLAAHRWRYARVERAIGEPCLFDPDLGIGACGDWCLGGKIEAAFASGCAIADRIVSTSRTGDESRTSSAEGETRWHTSW